MVEFFGAVSLLVVLLNPFALSVYLIDLLHQNTAATLVRVMSRACLIALVVFGVFSWAGEVVFTKLLGVRFEAFQIFGGLVFLLIGLKLMLSGSRAIEGLRGEAEHLAGAIAMPFMIGPGTVSASVLIGSQLAGWLALLAIATGLLLTVAALLVLKLVLDAVRELNGRLIERYVDIGGRVAAVVAGTVAVEMLMQGVEGWLAARPF